MIASIDDIRQRTWDFALTIVTVALLGALGAQSFVGTAAVWYFSRTVPGWQQGRGYADYVIVMNQIAAPLIVALVVVMGLCVPKRLFARKALIAVSFVQVVVGVVAGFVTRSLSTGLALYLLLSAAIQLAVVVLTVAGVRSPSYLTEGRLTKTGSGLLHLGFIVFTIVVVALQQSPMMLPVFWLSAVLVTLGTALSFYAGPLSVRRRGPREEAEFEWSGGEEHVDTDEAPLTDEAPEPQASSPAENPSENGST
jgi:hypothetical protein